MAELRIQRPSGHGFHDELDTESTGNWTVWDSAQRADTWAGKLAVSMRQTHPPGEKLLVDYTGMTLAVVTSQPPVEH